MFCFKYAHMNNPFSFSSFQMRNLVILMHQLTMSFHLMHLQYCQQQHAPLQLMVNSYKQHLLNQADVEIEHLLQLPVCFQTVLLEERAHLEVDQVIMERWDLWKRLSKSQAI